MAEKVGFEPTGPRSPDALQAPAFDHSATSPLNGRYYITVFLFSTPLREKTGSDIFAGFPDAQCRHSTAVSLKEITYPTRIRLAVIPQAPSDGLVDKELCVPNGIWLLRTLGSVSFALAFECLKMEIDPSYICSLKQLTQYCRHP